VYRYDGQKSLPPRYTQVTFLWYDSRGIHRHLEVFMCNVTVTYAGIEINTALKTFLLKHRLRAIVTDPPGCDTIMLVDYAIVKHGKVLLVLLEQYGHRAHLFMQNTPGEWAFRPVFKYQVGKSLHDTYGPRTVQIDCKELQQFLT